MADASDGDNAESSATTGEDSTSPANTTDVAPRLQPDATKTNPSAPVTAGAMKLEGDLNLLQGTWQVLDVASDAEQPLPASSVANMKSITSTFKDDIVLILGRMMRP